MTDLERARSAISRRRFLKGASLGIAAVGVAAVSRSNIVRASSASPSPTPDPQLAGDLNAVTENWAEPVVWRPVGTDPLGLRVVENENGLRFSYGGGSPGPTIRMSGDQTSTGDAVYGDGLNHIPTEPKPDWALGAPQWRALRARHQPPHPRPARGPGHE